MRAQIPPSFETLTENVQDANYSHWDDPFCPDLVIVSIRFEHEPIELPKKNYNYVLREIAGMPFHDYHYQSDSED
jgi:hypothetical protein